jgi:hypothetical protein
VVGNYNFTDGMYINYDNSYMNPGYPMYNGMPAPAQGCMGMTGGCPYMSGQGMNPSVGMRQGCPMMYPPMQYSNPMPVYNNMYGNYTPMPREGFSSAVNQGMNNPAGFNAAPPAGYMPGMVSMRTVSIKDIQD